MGTCCITGLQSKSRESRAGSPCMGTAHPFLRAAQCSGAGTCSRSRVGGLRRPALRARTLESIRKRGPARHWLAAASHTGAPGSGGGEVCCRGVAPPRPPGTPGRGEQGGAQPSGVVGASCQANGGPSSSENRAHRLGGDGEPCPGGVRSLLPGQGGAIFFRELGAPARGGRGVLPRGCSESRARPMGGHLLQRTGRTGLGGTGSPAQGVFGVSCQAKGGPSSS